MLANGKMTKEMVKGPLPGLMARNISASLKMLKSMAKGLILGPMAWNMSASGKMPCVMAKGLKLAVPATAPAPAAETGEPEQSE